jgi:hypothetical protein
MRSRSPWILLAVAALLFAYIWRYERPGLGPPRHVAEQRRVFPDLDPARVTAMTLTRSNLVLRLDRVQGRWRLADPSYPANTFLVDNWLQSVAALESSDRLDARDWEGQPGGLATLGLDPPRAEVTLEQGPRKYSFQLGDRSPLGSKMYLKLLEVPTVEVTGAAPLDRLPASGIDWRDLQFVHLSGLPFDRLEMHSAGREYEVQRDATARRWRLTNPRPARADHGRVELLLQQLQATPVLGFVLDAPVADLEPFGLLNPVAVLTLSEGTNRTLMVEFGGAHADNSELVYARRSNLPGIVLAPRETLDAVAVPYTELLDYRLIDRSLENLAGVEVTAAESFALEPRTDGVWQITQPLALPTDPGLTAMFLEHLRAMRVIEVTKEIVTDLDLPTYGLANPQHRIRLLWNGTPASAQQMELRLDFGTNVAGRVYVRRSDENPVYAVDANDAFGLPRAAFELRDRRLWQFQTNDVVSLSVTRQGTTQKLLRSSRGQWTFAPGSQGIVNTFALEEAVHRFGTLRARHWVARGQAALDRYGILQLGHRLEIELSRGGQTATLTLDFGAGSPSGGPFAALELEGEPTIFECPLDVFYPYDEVVRSMAPPR